MSFLKRIIPQYSITPVFSMIIIGAATYFITKLVMDNGRHYDVSLPIDHSIPLIPVFIVIYILSYLQWIFGYGIIAKERKEFAHRIISSEIIAKLICLFIFIVLPTSMVRPEITGNDIFSKLTLLIYKIDTPTNLFPSLHCLESWIIFRASLSLERHGKPTIIINAIFGILVFLSVLFVRQHLILDIPAAIIVGEFSLFIGKKFNTGRVFDKIDSHILRKGQV
ncbi:MAG: hypothetical protein IKL62_03690 [Clostridia bacterium]|nr:hypothetical protein [Clostridia bacterium]